MLQQTSDVTGVVFEVLITELFKRRRTWMKIIIKGTTIVFSFWRYRLQLLIFLSLFFFLILSFPKNSFCSAYLIVPDKLFFPEDQISIEAYLYRKGLLGIFQKGISGELLCFFGPSGNPLSNVLTDRSGLAKIPFKPEPPSPSDAYPMSVRLAENPRFTADPASGRIFIRHKNLPLFFTFIEGSLTAQEFQPFLPIETQKIFPHPNSAKTLTKIAPYYTPVYLSFASKTSLKKLRLWLASNNFPLAPLYLLDHSISEVLLEESLKKSPQQNTTIIESLWRNPSLPAYLVTTNHDLAKACAKKNIKVFLFLAETESGPPIQTAKKDDVNLITVQGWDEILSHCGYKSKTAGSLTRQREKQK